MQKKIIFSLIVSIIIASSILETSAQFESREIPIDSKSDDESSSVMDLYKIEAASYKMLTLFKQFKNQINFQQGMQYVLALLKDQSRAHHAVDIVFEFFDVDGDRKVSLANLKTRLQQVQWNSNVLKSGQYQKLEGEFLNAASQAFEKINQAVNNQQNIDSISYDTFYKVTEYYRQQAVNRGLQFFQTEKFHPYSFLQLLQKSKVVQFLTSTQIQFFGILQLRNSIKIIAQSEKLFDSSFTHLFYVIDADNSKSFSFSELYTFIEITNGRKLPSQAAGDISDMIKSLDKNGDQQVQLSEFKAAFPYFRQFIASQYY